MYNHPSNFHILSSITYWWILFNILIIWFQFTDQISCRFAHKEIVIHFSSIYTWLEQFLLKTKRASSPIQNKQSINLHKETMKSVWIRFLMSNNKQLWRLHKKKNRLRDPYNLHLKPSYPEIFAMLFGIRYLWRAINIDSAVESFLIDWFHLPFVPLRYYRDITFKLRPFVRVLTFPKIHLLSN